MVSKTSGLLFERRLIEKALAVSAHAVPPFAAADRRARATKLRLAAARERVRAGGSGRLQRVRMRSADRCRCACRRLASAR